MSDHAQTEKVAQEDALRPNGELLKRIEAIGGLEAAACYGCKKCSNGCPLSFAMDLHPYQVVRYVQLGQWERLKACHTIWICASCHTCVTRCPNQVDLPRLMDHLKQMVIAEGAPVSESRTLLFHRLFLDEVLKRGRVFEGALMGRYVLKTSGPFGRDAKQNAVLGWQMLKRGRISLLPKGTKDRRWLKSLRRATKGGTS
jgi:heterodisulfide reductase subunit C